MKKNNGKIYLILIMICLIFLVIAARMVQLHIIRHEEYSYKAIELSKKDINKYAVRGDILDRNDVRLAYSARYYDIWVNKNDVKLQDLTAEEQLWLDDILAAIEEHAGVSKEEFMEKMNDPNTAHFLLKKWANKATIDAIRAFNPRWISVYDSYRRVYPTGTLAANLIGTTDDDGFGRSGLEYSYNEYLAGRNGKYVMDTDLFGNQLALSNTEEFEPEDGQTVGLTLDSTVQMLLQNNLELGAEEFNTRMMIGLVQDIKSGEIIGMGNFPSYDLNDPFNLGLPETEGEEGETESAQSKMSSDEYWTAIHNLWSNPGFSFTYEPGSVGKMFTTAIGLEEGVFTADSKWEDYTAEIQVDDQNLKCASYPHAHGEQTTDQALVNSCNVAYVKMGLSIGADTMYDYMEALNLTYRSGLGVSGESFPLFQPRSRLIRVELATMAYGHGYSITPLQMLNACSGVVNDGQLMQPHLIKKRLSAEGELLYQAQPRVVRRVFSPSTSKQVREMMAEVPVYMDVDTHGFSIGGKTGTTLKLVVSEEDGQLEYGEEVISSFYAFGPVEDPRYGVLVVGDNPSQDARFVSAIQVAINTLADIMRYYGISNDAISEDAEVQVPDVTGITYDAAEYSLNELGFETTPVGLDRDKEQVVADQYPKPGVTVMKGTKVILKMEAKPNEDL